MKTIHFDYNEVLDSGFKNSQDIYIPESLNSQTVKNYPDVDRISVFIYSRVTSDIIDQFPDLKVIACRSAGFDHVDKAYAESKGIQVKTVPGYGPHVIATHAISLLLMGVRHLGEAIANTRANIYKYDAILKDTHNMTVGVIGTGKIGQEIIKLLKVLGCNVIAYDLYPNAQAANDLGFAYISDIEKVYSDSDAMVLSCNATADNANMINGHTISNMKKGAMLINIARGSLINEDDLITNSNHLGFVGLDAIKSETTEGLAKFNNCPNIYITPHIAYLADSTLDTIWTSTYSNLS